MPDNPSKLQNIQPPTQPSDCLSPGVVEADGSAGGEIESSPVTGAAEKSVERRPCDCEYRTDWWDGQGGGYACAGVKQAHDTNRLCRHWDLP